ncbi:RND transporter [Burkholderia sp. Bp8963]|nr:RND transporter [Burkholderia sp. Bp8963]
MPMSLISRLRTGFSACATAALASCALAPDGEPPRMALPAHYGVAPQPGHTVDAQGVAQHFEIGAAPVPQWWKRYGSDVLDALVDEGLHNSPTLAAAEKALAAAQAQLRAQIGNSIFPSVNAYGQADRERNLGQPNGGPKTLVYNVFAGQLQVNYTFDLFGAMRFANGAQASRVNLQAYQADAARRALAANIVIGVINIASLSEQIEMSQRIVALSADDAREADQRLALGASTRADAAAAHQNVAVLASHLPGLLHERSAARHTLAVLLGRTPEAAPPDLTLAALRLPRDVPVVVPSELLRTRPDILATAAALQAAAADVGVATARLYPSLSLTAALAQGGFTWSLATGGAGKLWSIAGTLTQPIFNGGALRAQRRAALDTYEAAAAQYQATVLSAFQDVATMLDALEQDAVALDAAVRATTAAHDGFDDTAARQRLGNATPAATRAAEARFLQSRIDELRFTSTRLADTATLFQAMGQPPDETRGTPR